MATLDTGRTRAQTISATSNYRFSAIPASSEMINASGVVTVGNRGVGGSLSLSASTLETRNIDPMVPNSGQWRYGATVTLTISTLPDGSTANSTTATFYSEWRNIADYGNYGDYDWHFSNYAGFVSLAESCTLVEQIHDDGTGINERITDINSTLTGDFTGNLKLATSGIGAALETQTFGASKTANYTSATGPHSPIYTYTYRFFNVTPGSISASCTISADGLTYSGTVAASHGRSSMSGGPSSVTHSWSGASGTTSLTPNGTATWTPDWGIEAEINDVDYETGDAVSVTHNHWYVYFNPFTLTQDNKGSFGTSYTYPTQQGLTCGCFDPGGGTFSGNQTGVPLLRIGSFSGTHTLEVDEAWADAAGRIAAPSSHFFNTKTYAWRCKSPFDVVTFAFAETHTFDLLNTADWSIVSGTGNLSNNGSNAVIEVENGPLKTTMTEKWKPFGYRYYKFKAKSSKANSKIRLKWDSYAWEITYTEADEWKEYILDICFPRLLIGSGGSETDFTTVLHPHFDTNFNYTGHPIEFTFTGDEATFEIESLIGYVKTDGTRTGYIMHYPMMSLGGPEGEGIRDASNYIAPPNWEYYFAKLTVNGARTLDIAFTDDQLVGAAAFDNIKAVWQYVKDQLGDNTGITITVIDTDETDFFSATGSFYQGTSSIHTCAAGGSITLKAEPTNGTTLGGYYGMGDPCGAYGTALTYTCRRIWNGEIAGIIYRNRRPVSGVEINLHEWDSPYTLLKTATSDDDGFYRIFHKNGHEVCWHNLPRGFPDTSRAATTVDISSPYLTYDSVGQLQNWYLIRGRRIYEEKDGDGNVTEEIPFFGDVKRGFTILEKLLNWYDLGGKPVFKGIDTKKHADGRVHTAYVLDDTIRIVRQSDMGSISDEVDTEIEGSFPRVEVGYSGGQAILIYINGDSELEFKTTEDDFENLN